MKKMWKRFVSLLLACTLLAGMLPLSASAAGEPTEATKEWVETIVTENYSDYISEDNAYYPLGESGLYWHPVTKTSVGEEGVVTDTILFIVPGEGATADQAMMPDYPSTPSLWNESNASALYIADGVTGIGSHAFDGMDTLEKVVFQDASKLTYVGSYAFSGDNKAQFTDEGNSGAAGDDPTRILDLSHVKKMGENAFYNCDGIKGVELSGSITAVETKEGGGTQEINNKIPNHAFESCNALTSITVPEGITTIGTAAFAGCTQADSITLPDSLVTIGDRAFMCSIDGANRSLTSLTIPENVKNIGASAFYGYKALATVTVESTELEKPGDAAFGDNEMSAYSGQQTVGGEVIENAGTIFKTPNANITELFVNYENCYLGPISPLTLIEEKSWPATCQHVGRNTYAYKYYEEEQELFEEIEMLPHVYITPSDPTWPEGFPEEKYPVDFPETCDTAPYSLSYCFNCLTEAYSAGGITAVTEPHTKTEYGDREKDPGHNYNCAGIENETIQDGKNTTISYKCTHDYHDDVRDGIAQEYGVTFKGFTLTADTVSYQDGKAVQNTLGSIAMPRNVYSESGTLVGAINWASSVNLEETLSEGTKRYPVVFTPSDALKGTYDGMEDVASYEDKTLQVTVTVSKTVLSLENLRFENVLNFMDVNSIKGIEATVAYQSQDLTSAVLGTEPKSKSYTGKYADGQNESTTAAAPVNSGAWDGTVTMTFDYDTDLYEVDTETANKEYTVVDSKDGTLQVTHTYKISKEDLSGASVIAISRPYLETEDPKALYAFRLINTPAESTVKWTWRNVSDFSETDNGTFITEDTSTNFAPIKEAGTYEIEVTISNPNCEPQTLTLKYDKNQQVTISPARVQIPSVNELTEYTGEEQTALNKPADTAGWQYTEESVLADTEAGTYTATAKLKDTRNYAWYDGNDPAQNAENGEYTITWSIAKRDIFEPLYQGSSGTYTLPYNRQVQKNALVDKPTKVSNLFKVEENNKPDGTTSWIGTFIATNTQVFEITNIGAQNASKYTIQAVISEEAFQNFQWENHKTNASFDLANWEITKYQVELNQVTAPEAVYTAKAYTGEPSVALPTGLPDNGLEVRSYTYYTYSGGKYNEIEKDAVIDAGTYYVRANYAFQGDTENSILKNYNLVQPRQYASFTITPCILTLNGTTRTEQYTGGKFTVTDPTVTLLEGDQGEAGLYTYTYTTYPEDDEQHQNPITHTQSPEYEDVGTYLVYVGIDSKNYSADPVECKLEIRSSNQTVKLTQEGGTEVADGGSISKTLGNDPFTVTGKGYVGENETNAEITYESSNPDTASVDENSGKVTLHKATTEGESVTITVTAAGSANYQKATATYTITVDKGTPEVTVQMPGGGSVDNTYSYTGKELSFTAAVTGAPDAVEPVKEEKVSFKFYQDDSGSKGEEILGDQPTKIGTYWVEAVYAGDDNYNPKTSEPVQFTISPAALEVEATGHDAIYDGRKHDPVKSITVTGVDGVISSEKYTISYAKKTDGQTDAPAADSDEWKTDTQVKDVADSGDYWIKVVINGDDSSYAPYVGKDPITVTVNPKPLQIEKDVTARKPYDGKKEATVDFKTINTGVDGEEISVTNTRAEYDSAEVNASSIIITYTLTEENDNTNLDNYSVSTGGTPIVNGSGKETVKEVNDIPVGIYPAPITVAINDQEKVYDGSVGTPSQSEWSVDEEKLYDVDGDGTKDDLGITLSIDSDSDAKDAGAYAIIGEADNKNYKVTFTGNWKGEDANEGHAGTYTIDPRPIDVQIGNAEGFYGDAPVLKGVELTYEVTDEENHRGLAPDENSVPNITLGTGASAQSPVAGYVIYAVDGNNDRIQKDTPVVIGNYNVTFTNEGTYTVNPRPITITIKDHSSKYGAEINGGIADPLSDKDYTVAITAGNTVTGGAIVNGDDLGITLFTTAKKGDNAGTYPISGEAKAESSVVSNYAITWKGENPFIGEGEPDSTKATYTVEKAELTVKAKQTAVYAQYGQETANPLTFTNASTGEEITVDDSNYETLENAVTYTLNPADSLTMETENKAEGKFTVNVTDTTVTVEVNVAETDNFKAATKITYDVYTSASGSLTVDLPFADLTYTSEEQKLLTGAPTLPGGVVIRYKLGEKGAWTEYSDADPSNWQTLVGTGAGDYTVYWETKAGGNYNASSGHETTEIKKANLSATYTGLNGSEVTLVLSEMGDTYTIPLDLTGNKGYTHSNGDGVTFLSGNTDVAIAKNSTATLELRGVAGEAKITINCPGDNNYNPGTFTFTVTVTDQKAEILYDVTGTTRDYNGQPQTIAVKVTAPASGATVMYWNEKTSAYDLSEPPAYTDVQDDGYTIKFRITAPGYNTVTDKATLKIEPKPITENMIAGIAESYTYTGSKITFDDAISVHDEGVLLTKSKDYTISYDDNTAVGTGTVTITGTGNYKGSVKKNFTISPVDASDLTASLDRTFGYYGDSNTNNATVTVTHGRHTVDSSEIELTVIRQDSTIESGDVVQEGLKLTFNKAGIYTIHVEVSGTHKGEFDLTYTLLPQDVASDDFQVTTNPVDRVWTYDGENRAFGVTVTSGGASLQKGVDFTLRYTYLPYVGNPTDDVYDLGTTVFTEAGIYTVIVEGTGNYTGHAELVALIQPRDLSDADITAAFAQTGLVYNGEAQEPDVTLTYNGTPINQLKNTEYYGNTNAGEAQALSAASEDCNNFTGARVDAFIIEKKSLNDSTITAKADPEKYYYTGYPVTPAVTVTDSGRNADLSIGADYTVSSDAVGPGKVTATVTGTGNYKDKVTVEFTILPTGAEPVETLNLTVTPSEWTWDNGQTKAAISVTFNGKELNDTDYQLTVSKDGETPQTVTKERAVELLSAPGEYTITATGVGDYKGSTDTETVTIQKIQPTVTVKATPNSLSGGGKVTLTLKGEKLPAFAKGEDLSDLLTVTVQNGQQAPDLTELEWTENQDGSLTAELTLPNTNETYTFALRFVGNDCYESASSDAMVVVGQQTSGGGGGSDPGDQPADPDDTGVSDWLNTKDHLAYLAGYPGGTFGPDQNMTRAEAAQMFYNLLLEKDVEITVEFEDVPADAWYAKPVNTLASLGILSGVGNGRFDPERSITRAEFTVIAMKFANTSGGGVNIFSDVNEDDWFYSAVVDSTQYGWINGYPDGTFRPEATISRAEVTVIVNHMLGRAADRPYVIAHEEELNTFGDVNRGHWGYFHVAEATNAHEYHTEDGTESWTGLS